MVHGSGFRVQGEGALRVPAALRSQGAPGAAPLAAPNRCDPTASRASVHPGLRIAPPRGQVPAGGTLSRFQKPPAVLKIRPGRKPPSRPAWRVAGRNRGSPGCFSAEFPKISKERSWGKVRQESNPPPQPQPWSGRLRGSSSRAIQSRPSRPPAAPRPC
ncbi:hypothetical protein T484DRAFT_2908046 [Baffinella frigidus]|nr:hypothetical protein T484DRAFT_2908046 [Cryptophyta sp. CCMP2293]